MMWRSPRTLPFPPPLARAWPELEIAGEAENGPEALDYLLKPVNEDAIH